MSNSTLLKLIKFEFMRVHFRIFLEKVVEFSLGQVFEFLEFLLNQFSKFIYYIIPTRNSKISESVMWTLNDVDFFEIIPF